MNIHADTRGLGDLEYGDRPGSPSDCLCEHRNVAGTSELSEKKKKKKEKIIVVLR